MVVVAGHQYDLDARGQGRADRAHDRLGAREHVTRRAMAQLERVAEQDEPVDAVEAGEQDVERGRAREHVGAAGDADVQVGDDEGAHQARGA